MEVLDQVIDSVALNLGFDGVTLFAVFAVLSLVMRVVGKAIPDDATGVLAIVRKVAKVIGLYVGNRITSGVTTNDAARGALTIANVSKVARRTNHR